MAATFTAVNIMKFEEHTKTFNAISDFRKSQMQLRTKIIEEIIEIINSEGGVIYCKDYDDDEFSNMTFPSELGGYESVIIKIETSDCGFAAIGTNEDFFSNIMEFETLVYLYTCLCGLMDCKLLKSQKRKFSVNVHYDFYANVEVEAHSEEEALEKAKVIADEMETSKLEFCDFIGESIVE